MEKLEVVTRTFDSVLELAAESRAAMAAKFAGEAFAVSYELGWMEAFAVEQAKAAIVEGIYQDRQEMEGKRTFAQVLQHWEAELTKKLLRNQLRGGSTSAFSNANEAAQREATSQMLEKVSSAIKWLEHDDA